MTAEEVDSIKRKALPTSRTFCWEEFADLEEDVMDMACKAVPIIAAGEFTGVVKITVEYIPEED